MARVLQIQIGPEHVLLRGYRARVVFRIARV